MTARVTAEPTDAVPAGGGDQPDPAMRAVLEALASVRDPELDEPITSLGFVASCSVSAAGSR